MQASQTKLRQLIEGAKQYVVPLFQRPYSWSEKQWKTLWVDIHEKARHGNDRPHFFGSIVTTPARTVPEGVTKYLLVDGQQRMTTIQIFLAALRDVAKEAGNSRLAERIQGEYLENKYEQGFDLFKVLPTQDDRASFKAIIEGTESPQDRIGQCYRFFRSCLDRIQLEELDALHFATVDRLNMVSISCDEHDNPQLIFESLNAKGEKLTPADLIRNFLLMKVPVGDQDKMFRTYWLPVQQVLQSDLTEFVRHYLMKEGKILKTEDVYFELKDRLANSTPSQAEEFLRDLHRHGLYYSKFVDPKREIDDEISDKLETFKKLKVTVMYPLLLRLFESLDSASLTREQVLECLRLLESFVIRRSVCNLPTNQLRRIFPPVFDATGGPGPNFVDDFRMQLGGNRCPDDQAFFDAIIKEPMYGSSDKNTRVRLMLERLERSYQHREQADFSNATIEHILPQTPTEEWLNELGEAARENWETLVHTIGNLTLSAYNSELSNQPYSFKKVELGQSNFMLNQIFEDYLVWNEQTIRERSKMLASRSLQVWPDVGRHPGSSKRENEPELKPVAVRLKNARQTCRNWRDGFVKLVHFIEDDCPGILERLADDETLYGVISRNPARFARSKIQIGEVFVNTHASASQLREWLKRIGDKSGLNENEYGYILAPPATSPINE